MAKMELRWIASSSFSPSSSSLGIGFCNSKLSSIVLPLPPPPSTFQWWRSISTNTRRRTTTITSAFGIGGKNKKKDDDSKLQIVEEKEAIEEIEEEEEVPWIEEKALDLVEFSGSVTQAIPGPRVGNSKFPWFLAIPLAYFGITFVVAVVKTLKKLSSPKAHRRRLVTKNVDLIKAIDELLNKQRELVQPPLFEDLVNKTGFGTDDILRKYIRYALNEKPFNPDLVADLIQLRKASMLTDSQVAQVLNDISTRIVKDKGPVVMDASGYSEKGFKRKLAVQALFGKVFYLSELPDFCSRDSSLTVKEIFGVTDEDADKLRIHTLSDAGDMESLEKMVEESGSDSGDNRET